MTRSFAANPGEAAIAANPGRAAVAANPGQAVVEVVALWSVQLTSDQTV